MAHNRPQQQIIGEKNTRSTIETNLRGGREKGSSSMPRVVPSSGAVGWNAEREEEDRQNNCVNYRNIYKRVINAMTCLKLRFTWISCNRSFWKTKNCHSRLNFKFSDEIIDYFKKIYWERVKVRTHKEKEKTTMQIQLNGEILTKHNREQ